MNKKYYIIPTTEPLCYMGRKDLCQDPLDGPSGGPVFMPISGGN